MTNSCTHTGNGTICETCMGRTAMEAQAQELTERLLTFIEQASHRKLRFSSIVNIETGDIGSAQARINQFIAAALTDAQAHGRRAGLEEAVVIAEGSRVIPVMREATSYYNAACLDVARVIRHTRSGWAEGGDP